MIPSFPETKSRSLERDRGTENIVHNVFIQIALAEFMAQAGLPVHRWLVTAVEATGDLWGKRMSIPESMETAVHRIILPALGSTVFDADRVK